jgi:hypothetical protein
MKILVYILSISNAILFTWCVQQERLNSKVQLTLPQFAPSPVLRRVPEAELLPDIQSFEDALRGVPTDEGPQGELFPDLAQNKSKKSKK